ncbi:hypothetical protein KJ359_004693 [Pestalotiopsis sp. 9143b]|nr:hypothetical protein KJ359_004693 [Pestalotiopsis sp. 9143b]
MGNDAPRMGAEYKYFCWADNWKMVPKSIWALAMLSMKDGERELVTRDQMRPIDQWWDGTSDFGSRLHREKLAKRRSAQKREQDSQNLLRKVQGGRIRKNYKRSSPSDAGKSGLTVVASSVSPAGHDDPRKRERSSKSKFKSSTAEIDEAMTRPKRGRPRKIG